MNSAYSHGFGTVMVVIDPDKFFGTAAFKDEMSEAVIAIKATPPANPKNPVLVPGDVENQQRQKNTPKIEISKSILDSIRAL
jgi:LDH2 family malate/lactate/ureidoglycolate dehydrogenase